MVEGPPPVFAVLFADISEAATEAAADEEVRRTFFERWSTTLSVVLADHGGMLIRSVGPTLRCSFIKADDAIRCAIVMAQTVAAHSRAPKLRAGIHVGEVILHGESYSGPGVTLAARMAMLAGPGQVICTPAVFEKATAGLRRKLSPVDASHCQVEFGDGKLYELVCNGNLGTGLRGVSRDDSTGGVSLAQAPKLRLKTWPPAQQDVRTRRRVVLKKAHLEQRKPFRAVPPGGTTPTTRGKVVYSPPPQPRKPPEHATMCLVTDSGIVKTINQSCPQVSVGRDPENDVVCHVDSASRLHADILWRDGRFVLVDHSSNGTLFYSDQDKEAYFVHQEEFPLSGPSGTISPGRQLLDPKGERLMYWIEA